MTNQKQCKVIYSMEDDTLLQQQNLLDSSIDDRSTKQNKYLVDTSIISVNGEENRYDSTDGNKGPILSNIEKSIQKNINKSYSYYSETTIYSDSTSTATFLSDDEFESSILYEGDSFPLIIRTLIIQRTTIQ